MLDPQSSPPAPDLLDPAQIGDAKLKTQSSGRRVALNALNPFVAQVVTKLMMLAYTIVQYRLIAGDTLGGYFLAAIVFSYTSTISEWGLGTLASRDMARGRDTANEAENASVLFSQTLTLRLLLSLALFPVVALLTLLFVVFLQKLNAEGAWAIAILTLSLLPAAFSGSVTALFYAYERMSLPALIGVATSGVNVALGVAFLYFGWSVPGLALSAFLTTLVTAFIFLYLLRRFFPKIRIQLSLPGKFSRQNASYKILASGWPLMLNALLVGLFFRADVFIIQAYTSELELARYQAAYSFLNFTLLITPAVTLALFPRMARHAISDRARFVSEYVFALKSLLILAVPIVVFTVWFAPLLISVVTGGKPEYQPQSVVVLQFLIFFLPFSFINGVTQYILIALDRQRLITRAFVATVIFNFVANLILVPLFGINGAALATIFSELVLLFPFILWTHREIGSFSLSTLALKPIMVGAVLALLLWLLWPLTQRWATTPTDFAIYALSGIGLLALYVSSLALLRPFSQSEWSAIKGAIRR